MKTHKRTRRLFAARADPNADDEKTLKRAADVTDVIPIRSNARGSIRVALVLKQIKAMNVCFRQERGKSPYRRSESAFFPSSDFAFLLTVSVQLLEAAGSRQQTVAEPAEE